MGDDEARQRAAALGLVATVFGRLGAEKQARETAGPLFEWQGEEQS